MKWGETLLVMIVGAAVISIAKAIFRKHLGWKEDPLWPIIPLMYFMWGAVLGSIR